MQCLRSLSLPVRRVYSTAPAATAAPSIVQDVPRPHRYLSADHLLDDEDLYDRGHEEPFHADNQPSLSPPPRYDWRTRATSRRRPGGLIDPPIVAGAKVSRPRRRRPDLPSLPTDPYLPHVANYKFKFLDLVKNEEENELNLIHNRLADWSIDKLRLDGYCLTGLSAYWLQASHFGKPIAAFLVGPGITFPYHRFAKGTQILLSRLDPLQEPVRRGSILKTTDTDFHITFDERHDLDPESDGDTWRLDFFTSNIAYQRMRAAIEHLEHDPGYQNATSTASSQNILQGTYLRDVLLTSFAPAPPPPAPKTAQEPQPSASPPVEKPPSAFAQDQFIMSWAKRYAVKGSPIVVEGDPDLSDLNATQRRAIAMMLLERVSLVQGPPGTGKTKTIIEAVKLLKTHFQVPHPLLVCTYTNVAVDNLVECVAAAGMRPLRVAFSAKVRAELLPYTLDAQVEAHPQKSMLDRVEASIDRLGKYKANLAEKMRELDPGSAQAYSLRRRMERMDDDLDTKKRRAWAIRNEIVENIVEAADVVCTTCITSASSSLRVTDFPVVFLDEASMSTEPASLIPLMKGCQHLALIGDHKQLPPVITSRKAEAGGLGVSLFERLTEEGKTPSIMLDMQYRMHPSLSRFPSSEFYNWSLRDGTVDLRGKVASTLLPPASSHLVVDPETGNRPSLIFLDHAGSEEIKDRSRVNHAEARIVCAVVEDLLLHNPTMKGDDIGIIAPYAAQISLLERMLRSAKYEAQLVQQIGALRAMQAGNIEVKTVDGFEGREKEVIIFSTVRNNAAGHLGFLADRRRMNVGLTRAKRGLFIVGSVGTLQRGKMELKGEGARRGKGEREAWGRYVEWLTGMGAVRALRGKELEDMLVGREEERRAVKAPLV